jgi:hypothetical protein
MTHEEVVKSVLEILNGDGIEHVTRDEASHVVKEVDGDISRALDELWNLMTIKQMTSTSCTKQLQEINTTWEKVCQELDKAETAAKHSVEASEVSLQWRNMCEALGLHECYEFIEILSKLSLEEKQSTFASEGFFQQVLGTFEDQKEISLIEEEDHDNYQEQQDLAFGKELQRLEALALEHEKEHPLAQLQALFPSYKLELIERMYEKEGYNLEKTAAALVDIQAIDGIQTYAAILSNSKPKGFNFTKSSSDVVPIQAISYIKQETSDEHLKLDSLGHFPTLQKTPSTSLHRKRRDQKQDLKPKRTSLLNKSLLNKSLPKAIPRNPWDHAQKAGINQYGHLEFGLNTQLKIERLQETLKGIIDKEVICAVSDYRFFLNVD